jgi:hypothetical protein
VSVSLEEVARRVNWYTDPDRLLEDVDLFLAQVMARGTSEDVIAVQTRFSKHALEKAYLGAPPGLFSKKAWAYWGLVLLGNPNFPRPERFPGSKPFDWRRAT